MGIRRWGILALFPGLLTPAFVTSSTNAGEGMLNLSQEVTYMDVGWMCRGMAHLWKNRE